MVEVAIGGSFPGIQTDLGAPESSPELHLFPFREPRRTVNRARRKVVAPCRERFPASACKGD